MKRPAILGVMLLVLMPLTLSADIIATTKSAMSVRYQIYDLGANAVANAINNDGMIVGTANTYEGPYFASVWQGTSPLRNCGTLGGAYSEGYGINNKGQVVGWSSTADNEKTHAFLWEDGKPATDLGTLGGMQSAAVAINDNGLLVGGANMEGDNASHAFLWQQGVPLQDLGTLGGTNSSASDINIKSQVVGWAHTANDQAAHAFLWQPGLPMQDLGTLGGAMSQAIAVNDSGQIVGDSDLPLDEAWNGSTSTGFSLTHAFLWENGSMRDLGTLGGFNSHAFGINNSAQIVGYSNVSGAEHAFLWENGVMNDLGTLGGLSSRAYGINDCGQIVGFSEDANGVTHAVLWQPVPEPSSLVVLIGGLGCIGAMLKRRRL